MDCQKKKAEAEVLNGHKQDGINIPVPEVTPPSISVKTETGGVSPSGTEIKVPRIPDIDFDIGTSQDEDDDKTESGKKIKIPKFGVPLPSMSSPDERKHIYGQEIQYEGPKIPKVKKAVFVLVHPPSTDETAATAGLQKEERVAESETEDVKVKMPKIKMKPSFGKSKDKSAAAEEDKSKGGKMKMPKVTLSSGKGSGSLDTNLKGEGSSSSLNGEKDPHKASKDDKGTFSGKIKLPKVELTTPYGKTAAKEEDTERSGKLGIDSSPGEVKQDKMDYAGFAKDTSKDVVSSHARTDMLDRDNSESPASFTMEFSSAKVQTWSESQERESSHWFKVPKITLKPHSTD